jgi:hypothetical protein
MLAALLLAAWIWDRTLFDCHGGSEVMGCYYFSATMRITESFSCVDGQGQAATCYRSVPSLPLSFGLCFPDPGTGATVSTTVDPVGTPSLLPTPPVGGVAAWPWPTSENPGPVVARDAAGNESREACP